MLSSNSIYSVCSIVITSYSIHYTKLYDFIGALVLDIFLGPDASLSAGLRLGLTISLVWIASSFAINYLYTLKPLKLFLIDAGYFVVFYAVEGTILGAW